MSCNNHSGSYTNMMRWRQDAHRVNMERWRMTLTESQMRVLAMLVEHGSMNITVGDLITEPVAGLLDRGLAGHTTCLLYITDDGRAALGSACE